MKQVAKLVGEIPHNSQWNANLRQRVELKPLEIAFVRVELRVWHAVFDRVSLSLSQDIEIT